MEHPQAQKLRQYKNWLNRGRITASVLLTWWLFFETVPGNGRALLYSSELILAIENPWLRIFGYIAALAFLHDKDFTSDEVEFGLAPELAHHYYGDIWNGLGLSVISAFFSFALAHFLVSHLALDFGVAFPVTDLELLHPVTLYWMIIVISITNGALTPLHRLVSRFMESRADSFASRATKNPEAGARAFERLGYQNKAIFQPPLWEEYLFATHPSLSRRIIRLRRGTHAHR